MKINATIEIPQEPRQIRMDAPGLEDTADAAMMEAISRAHTEQAKAVAEAKEYLKERATKWAIGSLSRINLILPPHPIRLSMPGYDLPINCGLIGQPGSEIHVEKSESQGMLFGFPGTTTTAGCMRRTIRDVIIKAPDMDITAMYFCMGITNLTIDNCVIYGCKTGINLLSWSTDTSIRGCHIENCRDGISGEGGHNCRVTGNSFLTCATGVRLVNCQSLNIDSNIFSQENSILQPALATGIIAQGKNIVIRNNSMRDCHRNVVVNAYGGYMASNYITYRPGKAKELEYGFMLNRRNYDASIGGTDWGTHAGMKPSMEYEGNMIAFDDQVLEWPLPVKG